MFRQRYMKYRLVHSTFVCLLRLYSVMNIFSTEDKLVVGCSDGSLIVYDLTIQKPLATLVRSSLVPSIVKWIGALILAGSGQGEVRLYDSVLNPLAFYDMEEKESSSLQVWQFNIN